MFWGCFSNTGVGELHEINEIMTGQGYAEIMKGPCISSINKFKLNEPLLLEDNDTKHKSKVAQQAKEAMEIETMRNYSPQSPDLNPIENL